MNKMMKQLQKMQAEMQAKMQKVQEELGGKTVEASAGGDMVTVIMNGHHEIIELNIKPEVVDPDDIEMLQDLIIAATNEAYRKATDLANEEMGKVAGGMNIPGLEGLF